ncbi:MAG: pyridoxamine 5'-phosphate oxidase family protein [Stigonema ocellatum SAG 48.90 = DSM 106950]|nr:pyridoxamine 5'-phosphate oxidase family protein [Stigonema ocellatum SAG 48.90 = DSM 106950]
MAKPGWSREESPFHTGEIAIQERLGVRDQIDQQGRRMIRDYLPDQHREFYPQLPFLIAGTVDAYGRPWASILVGEPGFLSTPDSSTLRVATRPLFGDPLSETLADGVNIGLLGIQLHTRRRNRMNGTVTANNPDGFSVKVDQSFGNCPKYIQARMFELTDGVREVTTPKPLYQIEAFGQTERALIAAADTFFIATASHREEAGPAKGVDVSHRGGKPGFVHIDNDHTLTFPDFVGNFMFNTIGNLEVNPHAGLLFVDFDTGNLLYLTGTAEVIWFGEEIRTFMNAERLIRFHLSHGRLVEGSLPLRWSAPDYSPALQYG